MLAATDENNLQPDDFLHQHVFCITASGSGCWILQVSMTQKKAVQQPLGA